MTKDATTKNASQFFEVGKKEILEQFWKKLLVPKTKHEITSIMKSEITKCEDPCTSL